MAKTIKVAGNAALDLVAIAAVAFVGWQMVASLGALLVGGFVAWVNWTLSLFPV